MSLAISPASESSGRSEHRITKELAKAANRPY